MKYLKNNEMLKLKIKKIKIK